MGKCDCRTSTGIHGGLTRGYGELDDNGFWEHPCPHSQPQWAVKLAAQISGQGLVNHSAQDAMATIAAILAQSEDVKRLVDSVGPLMRFLAAYESVPMDGRGLRAGLDDVVYCVDANMDEGVAISDLRRVQAALAPFGGGT